MTETAQCEVCGSEIEYPADVCDKHALSNEQLAEMMKRMREAQSEYLREIWDAA